MTQKNKKTVYFVRHGQSVDNASPVFQSVNSPLSDKGRQQAKSIAERLSHVSFETIIASPVPRAKETAGFIADQTGKETVYSDLFVETVKPHETDGKPWSDAEAGKVWKEWQESLYGSGKRVSDGENYDDIITRVDTALEYLLERPESTLTVVTHGNFLRALVARVLLGSNLTSATLKRLRTHASVENTAITVLHYHAAYEEDPAWRLWTLNDHSHFAE